ncbi:hypothetical protein L1049_018135 [Liquidambar formosana]|uniref:non-specific serine/threonine protein kinase n=1 Tax=Liquidambar formosana TaxID=63359 RepID=A0AAP0NKB2_LIQFO
MFFLLHYIKAFLLLLLSISVLITSINTQPTYNYNLCLGPSNDTANTSYTTNLSALLGSLSSKATLYSFYNQTSNQQIYSLFLCRGDVSNDTCQSCVTIATQEIQRQCPSNKTAIIWYDECMLRYSDTDFLGVEQTLPTVFMYNIQNTTSPDQPDYGALGLINTLISNAPYQGLMFGMDESVVNGGSQKGYGLVQCSRDISSDACQICLGQLTDYIKQCCQGKRGWRILAPSCNLRYEEYLFFRQTSTAPVPVAPPVPNGKAGKGGKNTTRIIIIAVSSFGSVAALLGLCFHVLGRQGVRETSQEVLLHDLEGSTSSRLFMEGDMHARDQDNSEEMHYFNFLTIQAATNNFSDVNKLGEGGFGPVYKGKMLDGKEIAVKRLSMKSGQGLEEFKNEVMLIVKLQHKNLVRLLGFCTERNEKLLVYEYLANTSLDAFLFDPTKSKQLDWDKRANLVGGIARGILYLHEDSRLKIIHRDLKASNILLDNEMNPKISDFGTARIFGGNQIEANTNRIVGTYGYMAPEYAMEGMFSTKSDVYSFGVLMLEIISGKKNSGFYHPERAQSFLSYVWRLWNEGKGLELIDQNLIDTCPISEALRWIHIALLCVQEDPNDRPTMSSVVLMLGSKSTELPQPSAPPFSVGKFFMSDQSSTTGAGTGSLTDQLSTSFST